MKNLEAWNDIFTGIGVTVFVVGVLYVSKLITDAYIDHRVSNTLVCVEEIVADSADIHFSRVTKCMTIENWMENLNRPPVSQ